LRNVKFQENILELWGFDATTLESRVKTGLSALKILARELHEGLSNKLQDQFKLVAIGKDQNYKCYSCSMPREDRRIMNK
jgi:hypothetical protein